MNEAESLYRQGTALLDRDPAGAVRFLTESLAIRPDAPPALYNRAVAFARLGRDADAIADVDRLESVAPTLGAQLRLQLKASAEPYTDIANREFKAGNFDKALLTYNSALTYDSSHAIAWVGRALALAQLGEVTQAMESFKKAATIEPDNYYVWMNLAEFHHNHGDFEAAISDYTKAIALLPSDPAAFLGRSAVFAGLGETEKSAIDKEHAQQLIVAGRIET